MSSIDRSNENSTRIPGVSSWTHVKLDRRSPALQWTCQQSIAEAPDGLR
jgi:hypothetical protein